MDPLRELFRYHSWATLRLLDHCAQLSASELDGSVPGTYGTVHDTLWHIVAADGRYIHRLQTGRRKPPSPEGAPTPMMLFGRTVAPDLRSSKDRRSFLRIDENTGQGSRHRGAP